MTLALFVSLLIASLGEQDTAEAHFAQGIRFTENGEHAKARLYFLKALELRPNSISILNNLGVNALNRGDEPAAEGYFRKTLALAPNDSNALFNLGLIELKQRKFAAAARHLRNAVSLRPADIAMLRGLLAAELELGKSASVDETVRRLLKVAPAELRFFLDLAEPMVKKGFHQKALLVLERAQQLWPDSAELHRLLGDVYEGLDLYEKSVEAFQMAVRLAPDSEEYWFALGYEFLSHRNFDLAEKIFASGISRIPRGVKLQVGLSAAYFARDQYAQAIAALRVSIDVAPESEIGYFFLGRAYVFLADHRHLFAGEWLNESFQKYIRLKPEDPYPYYLYAVRLANSEPDRLQAASLLKKSLERDPKFAEAHFELGKIYFEEQKYDDAIGAFEKAVALRPAFAEAHYRLGRAYAQVGNMEKAREASEVSVRQRKALEKDVAEREKEILRFVYTLK